MTIRHAGAHHDNWKASYFSAMLNNRDEFNEINNGMK
ncbi:Uncharacterised protein [Legionella feeleii]|uniref:Uncharacterized protein n=1 Tax=Legionella feeleii TaxID=453 RepID=A0A2X1QUY2_9GAMM|nr:Uncharacterised protein [Legionella feeleii]